MGLAACSSQSTYFIFDAVVFSHNGPMKTPYVYLVSFYWSIVEQSTLSPMKKQIPSFRNTIGRIFGLPKEWKNTETKGFCAT